MDLSVRCPPRRHTGIHSDEGKYSLSKRLESVPTSVMFEFADKIRRLQQQGMNVTDLSLGQPDVPAPDHISRALRESTEKPITSYTSAAGSLELRNLISESYSNGSGIETNPDNVVVTCGSKHALFISLLSLIDQGDEILVPEPFFPPYAEIAGLIGARLKTIRIREDERSFNLDVEKLLSAVSARTKVVLLNYPNNPAGWTLDGSKVKRIVEFCISKQICLVSDEIYDKIAFDNRTHVSCMVLCARLQLRRWTRKLFQNIQHGSLQTRIHYRAEESLFGNSKVTTGHA